MEQKEILVYILNSVEKKPLYEKENEIVSLNVYGKDKTKTIEKLIKSVNYFNERNPTAATVNKVTKQALLDLEKIGRFTFETPKNKYTITVKKTVLFQSQLNLKTS